MLDRRRRDDDGRSLGAVRAGILAAPEATSMEGRAAADASAADPPDSAPPDHPRGSSGEEGVPPKADSAKMQVTAMPEGVPHPRPPAPEPAPEPEPEPEAAGYTTCLDRTYVQKEIRWARQYGKKIVTVYDKDHRRPGHFDYEKARLKYDVPCTCGQNASDDTCHAPDCPREWKFLLDKSGVEFQRNAFLWDGMMKEILVKLKLNDATEDLPTFDPETVVAHRDDAINHPGWWHLFLSHNQVRTVGFPPPPPPGTPEPPAALTYLHGMPPRCDPFERVCLDSACLQRLAGDQMCTLSLLFEKQGKRCWFDKRMGDQSEQAMEEGVARSNAVVLFLTGEDEQPPPVTAEVKLNGLELADYPPNSVERREFVAAIRRELGAVVALSDYTLDSWLQEFKFAPYAKAIEAAGYAELQFLYDAEPAAIVELAATVGMPPPAARSFEKRCGQLRRLPERIRVREGELRAGSVIVAFDILPEPHDDQPDRSAEHEELAASKHTTVAIVATLQALIRDAAGLPQPADDPQYQMMTPLLSRLDPDHKLIARTSPAHAHEYARANPRWIDDEVCLCVSNEQALFELFQR